MSSVIARLGGRRAVPEGAAAIARLAANPTWELIPLKHALDQAAHIPAGATVSVTSSPAKGQMATIDLAIDLEREGFRSVPHLAARLIRDKTELETILDRMADAGIDRAFVIGGDPSEPGEFDDALALLRTMADAGRLPKEIGIGCYPQGHPLIADDVLLQALRDKAPFASYMTTQMCFDPRAIERFIAERRTEGLDLPAKLGVPGVAQISKLVSISARIGVRDASKFIMKNTRFVAALLRSGGIYRATGLLENLASWLADPAMNVIDLHLYTFNNVGPTEAWRRDLLAGIRNDG
jgi:methylenetetrahydrofolate reductase (NADPH)